MKALILAAGYGTRLQKDLETDPTNAFTHLKGVPKPLLPIGNMPLVSHWLKVLQNMESIDKVYLVTNATNHNLFEKWAEDWSKVEMVCDGSSSNETRIGAVGCMELCVKGFDVDDDLIVIAGDTLFYEDFSLQKYVDIYKNFQLNSPECSMLLYVTCTDDEVHKYGILETNNECQVTGFLEKPLPTETTSRKECPCFYFLSSSALPLLTQFLHEHKDSPMKARDATGNFIAYLYKKMTVYATEISGRFDVGGLESYIKCHQHFCDNK